MKNIQLKGGEKYITTNSTSIFEVVTGTVLVFLVPKDTGKRLFIAEIGEKELIPSFYYNDEILGEWYLILVALDSAEIKLEEDIIINDDLKLNFGKKIGLKITNASNYDEMLIEKYNLLSFKEEINIYATALEREVTYKRGLNIIYNLFDKKNKKIKTPSTSNKVYDGVAYLCDNMGISIAKLETIIENCGRKFTIDDIARVSHFTRREVILEEKWYKRDSGCILAFNKETKQPIACIPISYKKYMAYDASTNQHSIIDKKYAQTLDVKGQMFYPPFPNKELKLKDLISFGFKSVFISDIIKLLLLTLLGTLIGMLIPYMNEQLYDKFIPTGDSSGLVNVCFVILACTVGNITFTIVKNLATFRSINSMQYSVQSATYDRLFNLRESFFREYDSAELAQRAMGISSIYNILANVATKTLLTGLFSLLYLFRMYKYSSKLSNISIIFLLVFMVIIIIIGFIQMKYEKEKIELDIKVSSIMYQFLNGISKIRIAGVENRALLEYLQPYTQSKSINMRKERMTVFVNTLILAINSVFSLILYYLMIKNNLDLSIGQFMGFSAAFGSFSGAMLEIVSNILTVNEVKPSYENCKIILETLPEFTDDLASPSNINGNIEINNLTFSYNETSGIIIDDLSININAGEYVGIVGSSGSGKSTLLRLLLGFEKPDLGKIYYDGKDIESVDKRELRKKFGVVLQDGRLISGSIFENITITAPNTPLKRVQEVVKAVGLEDDIAQMPMGLHTVLSEDSGTISGGQQQRILIARAIVSNPKILYFDEATSALDNITQAMVCESLEKLEATRIVIAHRLTTVMNCDKILVLEKGKLIEYGSYQELMDLQGRFYELAIRQIT